jgi:tRNA uridine 5-carbamoylmethylation protein Kti12
VKKINLKNFKEPFVIMLIGPPLIGKSTLVKELLKQNNNITIISRDEILLEMHGSDNYNLAWEETNQKEVDKLLNEKFVNSNLNKENVIVDMTNLSSKRRKYNLSYFDNTYYKVAIVFPEIKKEILFERNKERAIKENKFISEHIIINMMESYKPIDNTENFNKIINL